MLRAQTYTVNTCAKEISTLNKDGASKQTEEPWMLFTKNSRNMKLKIHLEENNLVRALPCEHNAEE